MTSGEVARFADRSLPGPVEAWPGLLREVAALGVVRLPFAGVGEGGGHRAFAAALATLAARDVSFAAALMANSSACHLLRLTGTRDQQARWLAPLLEGSRLGAIALTEPEAGSDLSVLATTARWEQGWRLDGEKAYISNAGGRLGGPMVVVARLEADEPKLGAFVVFPDDRGCRVSQEISTIGWSRARKAMVRFSGSVLPEDRLLGHQPLKQEVLLSVLNLGRVAVAGLATGLAEAAFLRAREHARQRRVGGVPLIANAAIRFRLTALWEAQAVARLVTERAGEYADQGHPDFPLYASLAKLTATERAFEAARGAVQLHGALGVTDDGPVAELLGDAKVMEIVEGTSEIQRHLIAHWVLDR